MKIQRFVDMAVATLDPFVSQKFRFWSFAAMFFLVFVHGYNLEQRYLEPWTTPGESMTLTAFVEYLLANGLLRFRIPMLFVISGYLYALHDDQPYKTRTPKRLRTLLVPYLLWSAFGLAISYALELTTFGRNMIESSHVLQIDETRVLIHQYTWQEILGRWIFAPVSYQLWFIRVLLVYNIAYPVIRYLVLGRTSRIIFFSITFLLWLGTIGVVFIDGEGLLFFSLGVLIQKSDFSITAPVRWLSPRTWGIVFVLVAGLKTWLAFQGEAIMGEIVYFIMMLLHKIVAVSGLIACWYGLDSLVRWCMDRSWFVWLSAFSFIIYAMHAPFVAFAINPVLDALQPIGAARMIAFIMLPLGMIAVCVLTGFLLRSVSPKFYSVLTGGRGL